ncbi:MAG: hypothetical protein SVR94_13925 [Pseudomonadota bacterium]|nr:hypothetical protein [Pseudomonadota bacterium]
MQPEELLDSVEKLKKLNPNFFITIPEICTLNWPPRTAKPANATELRQYILDFQAQEGWICWQNEVNYFQNGELNYPEHKHLLYGEFAKKNASLHVNEDGQGGWLLTWFEEDQGETFIVENTHFLGEPKHAPAQLYYRVYWVDHEMHGYHKIAARFKGFA